MARGKNKTLSVPPPLPPTEAVEPSAPIVTKTRAATVVAPASKVYVLRVWSNFEKTIKGMNFSLDFSGDSFAPLVAKLRVNDRLYLQVWEGGQAIARSRVVIIQKIRTTGAVYMIDVEQTWGWTKDAPVIEVALTMLSLKVETDQYPVYPSSIVSSKDKTS